MKEKTKFLLEWERRWDKGEGKVNISELCRHFGISRDTGYRLIARYQRAGRDLDGARERSRRPHTLPTKVDDAIEDVVVQARKAYPRWGPKKLRQLIIDQYPEFAVPAPSTIGVILKRRGLSHPRKRRRRRTTPFGKPFAKVVAPNTTWCVDFKGQFRLKDGKTCYPLTIIDAHTRFLLRCEALLEPNAEAVERIFDSAFVEFGLPEAIRSDNGPPFATVGAGSLSRLSVWWIQLGIRPERIAPGKPQQNGRQERFHRTLKAETASPPRANLVAQRRAFDEFRREYNNERPHEALGQRPPARFYERSRRRYPRPLAQVDRVPWSQYLTVSARGYVVWDGKHHFLSTALAHQDVELRPRLSADYELYEVFFFDTLVAHLEKKKRNVWQLSSPPRTKRSN